MFTLRTYLADGSLWERQRFATEAEARETAVSIGGVRGQKSWRNDVFNTAGERIAIYRGGFEVNAKKGAKS